MFLRVVVWLEIRGIVHVANFCHHEIPVGGKRAVLGVVVVYSVIVVERKSRGLEAL